MQHTASRSLLLTASHSSSLPSSDSFMQRTEGLSPLLTAHCCPPVAHPRSVPVAPCLSPPIDAPHQSPHLINRRNLSVDADHHTLSVSANHCTLSVATDQRPLSVTASHGADIAVGCCATQSSCPSSRTGDSNVPRTLPMPAPHTLPVPCYTPVAALLCTFQVPAFHTQPVPALCTQPVPAIQCSSGAVPASPRLALSYRPEALGIRLGLPTGEVCWRSRDMPLGQGQLRAGCN